MVCKNPENFLISTTPTVNVTLNEYAYTSKCFISNIMEPAPAGDASANPIIPDPPLSPSNTRCHVYSCSSDSSTITITSSYPTVPGFSVVCGKTDAGAIKTVTY